MYLVKRSVVFLLVASTMAAATVKAITVFQRDNSNQPLPRLVGGHAVYYDREASTVSWYLLDGSPRGEVKLSLPDTAKINVVDVTARKDGVIAVAATAMSEDQAKSGAVVFWIGPHGKIERTVRTTPFVPIRLMFAPNGHLWAVGMVKDSSYRETPRHDILWEFDGDGQFVRSTFPVDSITAVGHPAQQALLATNGSTLGFYSPLANEYIETDGAGAVLSRTRVSPAWTKATIIAGLALTANGNVYLGGSQGGQPVLYRLDRRQAQFVPVEIPPVNGPVKVTTLLGADGNDLLFYAKPSGAIRISLD